VQAETKVAEQKATELANQIASAQVADVTDQTKTIAGIKALVQIVTAENVDALRSLGDKMRDKVDGVVVLAAVLPDAKVSILTMATKEAVAAGIHAGNIVKEIAKLTGGGGGGRADMAQAGGKDASKLEAAMQLAWELIANQLK
ncbi:MAG: DHHA1 domain-containing protein, partial [Acidaminococcaceae bacterium]